MNPPVTKEKLFNVLDALLDSYLGKIRDNELTVGEAKVLLELFSSNSITVDATENPELARLINALPFRPLDKEEFAS